VLRYSDSGRSKVRGDLVAISSIFGSLAAVSLEEMACLNCALGA
jgi:hypothetical protein